MDNRWMAIEEIKQLKARYFRFLDTQNWSALADVFTPDAKIAFPELNQAWTGGESFARFASEVMTGVVSVHIGYMPEITLNVDGTASGIWGMTDDLDAPHGMPQSNGTPVRMRGAGHYHEQYVRIDGTWKIAGMTLTRLRLDVGP